MPDALCVLGRGILEAGQRLWQQRRRQVVRHSPRELPRSHVNQRRAGFETDRGEGGQTALTEPARVLRDRTRGVPANMTNPATLQMIGEFERRSGIAFPNLGVDHKRFAGQLRDRLSGTHEVNQGAASLCGPAAFMYCFQRKNPMAYAKYAMDLFENASAWLGHMKIEPSEDCRKSAGQSLSALDWVTLAGLRDAQNLILDYEATEQVAGITNARSLAQWFSRSGYFAHVARETNIVRDKSIETLVRASRHLLAGRWPCLMIGANVLTGEPRGRAFPDHWVVLASEVRIDGSSAAALFTKGIGASDSQLGKKKIFFSVLSWGKVSPIRSSMTVDEFLDFFYGYVTAQ